MCWVRLQVVYGQSEEASRGQAQASDGTTRRLPQPPPPGVSTITRSPRRISRVLFRGGEVPPPRRTRRFLPRRPAEPPARPAGGRRLRSATIDSEPRAGGNRVARGPPAPPPRT